MLPARGLLLLVVVLCATLSCAGLAQPRPPAFAMSKPVVTRYDSQSDGNVTVNIHVWQREYSLPGSSLAQVRANLLALDPGGAQGDFSGYTKWDLTWNVHYNRGPGGCGIASATVEVDTIVTVPALQDESQLSSSDLAEWRHYLDALDAHELSHVDNEVSGANAMRDVLSGLDPAPDCKVLGSQIQGIGEQQKQSIHQADDELDAKTDHGALTGATFR
ncbi:MAG TPA: DUF922 domain-containing protein [Dehalococcoidia bacterium]|nr:DUF922 domain-containing protein [Dehalococcoidia bacterium]